jgi:hypothetical protein
MNRDRFIHFIMFADSNFQIPTGWPSPARPAQEARSHTIDAIHEIPPASGRLSARRGSKIGRANLQAGRKSTARTVRPSLAHPVERGLLGSTRHLGQLGICVCLHLLMCNLVCFVCSPAKFHPLLWEPHLGTLSILAFRSPSLSVPDKTAAQSAASGRCPEPDDRVVGETHVGPLAMWRVEAGAVPVLEVPPSWRRRNGFRPRLAFGLISKRTDLGGPGSD